jgi:hypothetical protein
MKGLKRNPGNAKAKCLINPQTNVFNIAGNVHFAFAMQPKNVTTLNNSYKFYASIFFNLSYS